MPEWNIRKVYRHHGAGVAARQLFGDRAAPVAAVRSESLVAESLLHQLRPEILNAEDASDLRRPVRKSIARQIGYYDIEGILRPPAERQRIGENRNEFREPVKRIRIAVG